MQQAAAAAQSSVGGGAPQRSEAYLALKEQWKQSALEILFMYFPKVESLYSCMLVYFPKRDVAGDVCLILLSTNIQCQLAYDSLHDWITYLV
jgi:hypothetical protein